MSESKQQVSLNEGQFNPMHYKPKNFSERSIQNDQSTFYGSVDFS